MSIFYKKNFLPQSVHLLIFYYNLKILDYDFIAYIYHGFLKSNDFEWIINKSQKLLNIAIVLMWSINPQQQLLFSGITKIKVCKA